MTVTIHQPEHLPWLGFFNKMSMADIYVIFDDVQFEKNNFQNRNRIMGTNGPQWIGVPVNLTGHTDSTINDITIANKVNPKWAKKYLNTLICSYSKYPYFDKYIDFFVDLFSEEHNLLYDINEKIIFYFAELLEINPKFIRSSEIPKTGKKSDQILSICQYLNADKYIAGSSGRDYLKEDTFRESGIEIVYQSFTHPTYLQYKKKEFTPYLSTLDLLFNEDKERARQLIVGE